MHFAVNGDAILTSCTSVACRQLELVWKIQIPQALRGSTYTFVSCTKSYVVTLLVTQGASCFQIRCDWMTCSAVTPPVTVPLIAGDEIQLVYVVRHFDPHVLLLVSPNMAIPFNTKTMTVYEKPMNWTQYSTYYKLRTVTSLTPLFYNLFISLGTDNSLQGVGAIVSLSNYLHWNFKTITFFTHTPSNMGSNGDTQLYWAQSTNTSGLLWSWPSKDYVETPFSPGERWAERIASKRSIDGTILLASGKPKSHAGFTFWTPNVQFVPDLGNPQPFSSPARGWALPYLSETTSQGVVVTSQTFSGLHDLLFLQWGIHALDAGEANEKKKIETKATTQEIAKLTAKASSTNDWKSNWKDTRRKEMKQESKMFAENCKASSCDLDVPGDCDVGHCWGTGGKGARYMCCTHPPV